MTGSHFVSRLPENASTLWPLACPRCDHECETGWHMEMHLQRTHRLSKQEAAAAMVERVRQAGHSQKPRLNLGLESA